VDGDVDFTDFQKLETGFDSSNQGWLSADFDGDGDVDRDDLATLNANYNTSGGAVAPAHTRTVDSANEITNISQRAFSFSHFILHPSSFILLHSSSPPTFSSPPDRGPIPVR
jgi:hypothetical protein